MIFVLKASYTRCNVRKFKPVHQIERVNCETKLFEFLVGDVPNRRVKAEVESKRALEIPLEYSTTHSDKWSLERVSNDRCLKSRVETFQTACLCTNYKLLYMVRNTRSIIVSINQKEVIYF